MLNLAAASTATAVAQAFLGATNGVLMHDVSDWIGRPAVQLTVGRNLFVIAGPDGDWAYGDDINDVGESFEAGSANDLPVRSGSGYYYPAAYAKHALVAAAGQVGV